MIKRKVYSGTPKHYELFHPLNFSQYTESVSKPKIKRVSLKHVGSKSVGVAVYDIKGCSTVLFYEREKGGKVSISLSGKRKGVSEFERKLLSDSESDIANDFLKGRRNLRDYTANHGTRISDPFWNAPNGFW